MAVIEDLELQHYDRGQRVDEYYFLSNFTIPAGIGNFIIVRAVAKYAIKVQLENCTLEESLSTPEIIKADLGEFAQLSDGQDLKFILDPGVSYLKAINNSATLPAKFNISCI